MRALIHSLLVCQFSGIYSTISDDIRQGPPVVQRAVSLLQKNAQFKSQNSLIYGTTCLIVAVAVAVVVAAVAVADPAAAALACVGLAPYRMTAVRLRAHIHHLNWTVNKAVYTIKPILPLN